MKTYHVQFFYYTDERCEWKGEAVNEMTAIGMALTHHRLDGWCNHPGFRIVVTRAEG